MAGAVRVPALGARRVTTGIVVAAIALAAVFFTYVFDVLVVAIAIGCLWELARLCERKGQALEFPVALAGILVYAVLAILGALHKWEGVLIGATVVTTLAFGMIGSQRGYVARTAFTLLAVLYIGKLLTYIIAIRLLPGVGLALTLYLIAIVALTDIGSMLAGMAFGRTPLSSISPRKTIEGAVGGFALALAAAFALGPLPWLGLAWWQAGLVAATTSIAAQAGDLVESSLKRDADVKDAGSAIQGHGGMLDRFDSYLFGGIAFYGALHVSGVLASP